MNRNWLRCDVRIVVSRVSQTGASRTAERYVISEHRRTRLKYMRDEPQDADDAVQVRYKQTNIIDVDVE